MPAPLAETFLNETTSTLNSGKVTLPAKGIGSLGRDLSPVLRATAISIIGGASLYALLLRLPLIFHMPLWVDESWTAMISASPSWNAWLYDTWLDSNAPLYYFLVWLWPFESNTGLKFLSLLFLVGAVLAIAFWRPTSVSRGTAFFWAALILLWEPGLSLFTDARYYGLLFFVSTLQSIALLKLIDRPDRRNAALWAALGTTASLIHYYAAIPALIQGLAFAAVHKRHAVRQWPVLILTIPAFAWLIFHWPRLQLYADMAWYDVADLRDAIRMISWTISGSVILSSLIIAIVLVFRRPSPSPIAWLCGASALATLVLIGMGMLRPMMIDRYLIPLVPSLLLAVASYSRPVAHAAIAALFLLALDTPTALRDNLVQRATFGIELPAKELPGLRSVAFYIAYPGAVALDTGQMERVTATAFRRIGRPVAAEWGIDGQAEALIYLGPSGTLMSDQVERRWRCQERSVTSASMICFSKSNRAKIN